MKMNKQKFKEILKIILTEHYMIILLITSVSIYYALDYYTDIVKNFEIQDYYPYFIIFFLFVIILSIVYFFYKFYTSYLMKQNLKTFIKIINDVPDLDKNLIKIKIFTFIFIFLHNIEEKFFLFSKIKNFVIIRITKLKSYDNNEILKKSLKEIKFYLFPFLQKNNKENLKLSPDLHVYYPLNFSIISILIRITGVILTCFLICFYTIIKNNLFYYLFFHFIIYFFIFIFFIHLYYALKHSNKLEPHLDALKKIKMKIKKIFE